MRILFACSVTKVSVLLEQFKVRVRVRGRGNAAHQFAKAVKRGKPLHSIHEGGVWLGALGEASPCTGQGHQGHQG